MTPLQQLQAILAKTYKNEDGETFALKALPGLTDEEVEDFRLHLPSARLPAEVEELVRFARGFDYGFETVRFDQFRAESPYDFFYTDSIELMGDGAGNCWILDIAPDGAWGPVYYNCHEDAVIIRHSDNLLQFLRHVDAWLEKPDASHISRVLEKVYTISDGKTPLPSNPQDLPVFPPEMLARVPANHLIADLTHARNATGFSWKKYSRNGGTIVRHPHRPAWLLAYKKPGSWWTRLFTGK